MGFMTEIGILNDRWSEIEADPKKFVEQIKRASNDYPFDRGSYVVGQTTVHPSHHADESRIYLAERNGFYNIGEYGIESELCDRNGTDDHILDFYEDEIDRAMKMLKNAKKYVQYLRAEVGFDERPGGKDYTRSNDHHVKSWRWKKPKKAVAGVSTL